MIEIDGSFMEGGGQIIRTAVALSAITGKSCRIEKIRAGRPNPGLQAQHMTAVRSVAKICSGETDASMGATSLTFRPGEIKGGRYEIDIGTAGAISLVLQSVILPSIHAEHPTRLEIKGGTHVRWSPSMDYMQHVFCYWMKKIGLDVSFSIDRHGFYPKGGGIVTAKINPGNPKSLDLTVRGDLVGHEAVSIASTDLQKAEVAERQLKRIEKTFPLSRRNIAYFQTASPGSAIHLSSIYENCVLGASSIGERGKSAEKVGEEAANELKRSTESGACFDLHMADQILPFLAFAKSNSRIKVAEITGHVRTNIWVIEKFLPVKFEINEKEKIIEISVD